LKLDLNYHIGRLAAFIIKPIFSSYRYQVHFEDPEDAKIVFPVHKNTSPVIFAFFHQHEFNLMPYFMDRSIVAIVSQSKDGSLLAGAMEYFGFLTARGSSHRGGNAAFHECLKLLSQGHSVCVAVDGPKGPIFKVKHGAVTLSERSRIPIVPISAKPSHAHQFTKSWEQSYLPYPFSKIDVYIGKVQMYSVEELEKKLVSQN
jgi:lysophospholipid acyltransferase (LPLAT)-like uncharacterized protein